MKHSTTNPTTRHPLDTVETVAYDETGDVLLWVEDARPTVPATWDTHTGDPSGGLATAQRQKEEAVYRRVAEETARMAAEVAEIDFMDAALEDFRRNGHSNGCPGLHEDPNDTRMDYREARRPTF